MAEQNEKIQFDPDKPLQVGGQAVIEGVMMRAPGTIATAVRRADGSVIVRKQAYRTLAERYRFFRLPVLRGAVGLVEMMFVGIETLNFSAEVALLDIQAKERAAGKNGKEAKSTGVAGWKIAITVIISLAVGVALFFVTPLVVATKLFSVEQSAFWFNLIAGGVRLSILLGYLYLISLLRDVQRLFRYHGGEHKAVMTFESRCELLPATASLSSRFHPRCGTSFILIVMVAAVLMFAIIDTFLIMWLGAISLPVRLVTHLPLIPVVGGISYEFIRWSSRKTGTWFGRLLVAPGLWLQRITTKEPDPSQLEVALIALRAALGMHVAQPVTYVGKIGELHPDGRV